jgi:uncharacterized repeat protein (TIGR01451 family)
VTNTECVIKGRGARTVAAPVVTPVAPAPPAPVVLDKELPAEAVPGEAITVTIRVAHPANSGVSGCQLTEVLPPGLEMVAFDQANCTFSGGLLQCPVDPPTRAGAAIVAVAFTARVVATSGTLCNEDYRVHVPGFRDAVGPSRCLQVQSLSVAKTAPASVAAGQPIPYRITVSHPLARPVAGVRIVDRLPAGLQYQSVDASRCTVVGNELRCDLGVVAGPAAALDFTVRVVGVQSAVANADYEANVDGRAPVRGPPAVTVITPVPDANAPVVRLLVPVGCEAIADRIGQVLLAEASDPDGDLLRVEFVGDGTLVATRTVPPFRALWSGLAPGRHCVAVRAVDAAGHVTDGGTGLLRRARRAARRAGWLHGGPAAGCAGRGGSRTRSG